MNKRVCFFVSLVILSSGFTTVKSQDLSVRDQISYINTLLKLNPYRDTFLEIYFYYSVDITPEKELVVNMDFDGPFRTVVKARVIDLDSSFKTDTAQDGTSSICWYCKSGDKTKESSCVLYETITKGEGNNSHYSENICVMIPRRGESREKLIIAFEHLFKKVLEE
jgi:hypothetical protein